MNISEFKFNVYEFKFNIRDFNFNICEFNFIFVNLNSIFRNSNSIFVNSNSVFVNSNSVLINSSLIFMNWISISLNRDHEYEIWNSIFWIAIKYSLSQFEGYDTDCSCYSNAAKNWNAGLEYSIDTLLCSYVIWCIFVNYSTKAANLWIFYCSYLWLSFACDKKCVILILCALVLWNLTFSFLCKYRFFKMSDFFHLKNINKFSLQRIRTKNLFKRFCTCIS